MFLPVDEPAYLEVSERVMETLRSFPAVVEVLGWDEAFMEPDPVPPDPEAMAHDIQRAVQEATGAYAGMVMDRFGSRRFVLFGTATYAAANALIATAQSAMALIGFRGLAGLGGGANVIATSVYVSHAADPARLAFFNSILAAARSAERVGSVIQHRFPATRWRRYDKLKRFPAGLLPIGDAIASLNPTYGQGMTVAAMQAEAMHEVFAKGMDNLTGRYLKAVAKPTKLAWSAGVIADLAIREREGRLPMHVRVGNAIGDMFIGAAQDGDIEVLVQLFRVVGFDDPPRKMFRPAILGRAIGSAIRRRLRGHQSPPSVPERTESTAEVQ